MRAINISYLNRMDVERVALTDDDILDAVEVALRAQGNGETVLEPRVHLVPESSDKGHFNVLRGVVRPLGVAGVKVVGVFPESSHDPIIYPVAATVNAKPDATPYLAFLRSQAAKTIFVALKPNMAQCR